MKILPIDTYYNNINFTSKVTRVINGSVPEDIKDKVDLFEETNGKNDKKLGQGLFAEAYLLGGTNCVIKRSKQGKAEKINGDFSMEATALMNIPKDFSHAQSLIGNVETEDGKYYLLTTFMEGKIPDGEKTKWDGKSLASILSSLAKLDSSRVYHGDVSRCNCLITEDGEVNLLDFQYCEKFGIETEEDHKINAKTYKVPFFMAPSNAQMFEESNFATYLSTIDETKARELFKTYLEEKANYHQKRAEAFEKQGVRYEITEYDKLMAKYLKHPSDEMINLQARKLQLLLTHRFITSSMDTEKQEDLYNIMSAPVYYLYAIEASNEMSDYAEDLRKETSDPELKKLLKYETDWALFWRSMMKNELEGRYGNDSAFEWILRNAADSPQNEGDNILPSFIKTSNKPYKQIPDILHTISDTDVFLGFEDEIKDNTYYSIGTRITELRKTQSFSSKIKSPFYKDLKEYHKIKQEIMKNLKAAEENYLEGAKFESLFYSLSALYQSTVARTKAQKALSNGKLSQTEKERMIREEEFLNGYVNDLCALNYSIYEKLFKKASGEN